MCMNCQFFTAFAIVAASVVSVSHPVGAIPPHAPLVQVPALDRLRRHDAPKLLVLGNSLVFSVPSASWSGTWGVAASAPENDFAHLLSDRLGAELTADTIYPFEQQYAASGKWRSQINKHANSGARWVVIKLGDNVDTSNFPAFEAALSEMIDTLRGDATVVCVGTWYRRPVDVDDSIARTCTARGARFVSIADLYFDFSNHALAERFYEASGIGSHPGDKGMAEIASRVHRAIVTRHTFLPIASR
jgi:hypothetical protein